MPLGFNVFPIFPEYVSLVSRFRFQLHVSLSFNFGLFNLIFPSIFLCPAAPSPKYLCVICHPRPLLIIHLFYFHFLPHFFG